MRQIQRGHNSSCVNCTTHFIMLHVYSYHCQAAGLWGLKKSSRFVDIRNRRKGFVKPCYCDAVHSLCSHCACLILHRPTWMEMDSDEENASVCSLCWWEGNMMSSYSSHLNRELLSVLSVLPTQPSANTRLLWWVAVTILLFYSVPSLTQVMSIFWEQSYHTYYTYAMVFWVLHTLKFIYLSETGFYWQIITQIK